MNKRRRSTRGSVNVFVALMMIPMMAFTGLMVDFSRMAMATAQAQNAASLAALSAIAYYDALLFDMFGLIATSQDWAEIDRFGQEAVRRSLSRGRFNLLGEIRNVEVTIGPGGGENSENFSLNNMAYLQHQIAEYMKIRVLFSWLDEDLDELPDMGQLQQLADFASGPYEAVWGHVWELHRRYETLNNAVAEAAEAAERLNNLQESNLPVIMNTYAEINRDFNTFEHLFERVDSYTQRLNTELARPEPDETAVSGYRATIAHYESDIAELRRLYGIIRQRAAALTQEMNAYRTAVERVRNASSAIDTQINTLNGALQSARSQLAGMGQNEHTEAMGRNLDAIYNGMVRDPSVPGDSDTLPFIVINEEPVAQRVGVNNTAFLFATHGLSFHDNNVSVLNDIRYGNHTVQEVWNNANSNIVNVRGEPNSADFVVTGVQTRNVHRQEYDAGALRRLRELLDREDDSFDLDEIEREANEMRDEEGGEDGTDTEATPAPGSANPHPRPNLRNLPAMPAAYRTAARQNLGAFDGQGFGGFADSAINRLLLIEYALQMFSNFTTNRVKGFQAPDGGGRSEDWAAGTRWLRQDRFEETLTGIDLHHRNGYSFWFGAEAEFIATGNSTAQGSLDEILWRIRFVRAADNLLYTFRSPPINRRIMTMKAANPPISVGVALVYRAGIIAVETERDIRRLLDGGRVPLVKSVRTVPSQRQWTTGTAYAVRGPGISQWNPNTPGTRIAHEGEGLYYYQWLRLLMIANVFDSNVEYAQRIATLIEVNMNYHLALQRTQPAALPSTPTFRLSRAFVNADVTIEYDFPHFFIGAVNFGEMGEGGRSSRWRASAVRGY